VTAWDPPCRVASRASRALFAFASYEVKVIRKHSRRSSALPRECLLHSTGRERACSAIDRIDIHVEVPRVDYEKLADKRQVEDSKTVRARVQAARERQLERFKGTKLTCNAEMGPTEVREFCQTDASGEKLLKAAVQQLHLSARAYHRVLKLARTIADLAGSDMIMANHVAEAVQYRPRVGM